MKGEFITKDVTLIKTGLYQIYVDYWWWCKDGDSKKALFYKLRPSWNGTPQCNIDKTVLEFSQPPSQGFEIIKIPFAYISKHPADFI